MKLSLHVSSYKTKAPVDTISIIIDQKSATIGRLPDNTLVLPDPMRYLSGHHAKIKFQSQDYYLTDTSTNGVFINNSSTPLGYGNTIKIQNRDLFKIGEYEIFVQTSEQSQRTPTNIFEAHIESNSLINKPIKPDSIFFVDTPSDPIKQMIESSELMPDTWGNSTNNNSDIFTVHDSYLSKENLKTLHEIDRSAPYLEAFEQFNKNKISDNNRTTGSKNISDVEVPVSQEAVKITNDTDFLDDWFVKDTEDITKSTHSDTPDVHEQAHFQPKQDETIADTSQTNDDSPSESTSLQNNSLQDTSLQKNSDLIKSFLEGANLKDEQFKNALNADTFHTIGVILRSTIQGTMDVLYSRARIKSEMHLDITTIRAVQNNPIKFSVSAGEALSKLLLNQDEAYLKAEEAISEVFSDISAHQLSVIAGMKTALSEVLKRFDPNKLEQVLQQQSPMAASIPVHKQAKLWRLFEQLYKEIGHETEDNFYQLFGHAFSESYNKQVNNYKSMNSTIQSNKTTPEL